MGFFDGILNALKPLKPLIMPLEIVGKKVAVVINTLLLSIVYFTAFAATSIIAKIIRKRFLDLGFDKGRQTYWQDRKKEDYGKKEAYRGF